MKIQICTKAICGLIFLGMFYPVTGQNQKKVKKTIVIENFDSFKTNEELSKIWYHPEYHGGPLIRSLEPKIKEGGKYSLKCTYTNQDDPARFYSPVCCVSKWDASGCNAFRFWYRPDGSGREMTIQFNVANKEGNNIHDLWEFTYYPEKNDSTAKTVILPFKDLRHNIKFVDADDHSPVFKPEALIEVAIYIGGRMISPEQAFIILIQLKQLKFNKFNSSQL
ncbi:MAG: hypothetical protein HC906_15845 [Bacteroidales bacterium]|nr:hypothetical protein [Bacteroidales bacterium]